MNSHSFVAALAASAVLFPAAALAQAYYDLDFGRPVQTVNATHSTLGAYYTGSTFEFTNVAPTSGVAVDLRTRMTGTSGNYSFTGSFPDYSSNTGEPDGDLGYLYQYDGGTRNRIGGITYELDFFNGGGSFTSAYKVPDFRLMMYDVDGETSQTESVRVNIANGFYGYQIPKSNSVSVVDEGGGWYRFTGAGTDYPETDTRGAFILYFSDTSSVSLNMVSNTRTGSGTNGVFSAIDGDLSMLGGNFSAFNDIVYVPETSSAALLALAALGLFRRRRADRAG